MMHICYSGRPMHVFEWPMQISGEEDDPLYRKQNSGFVTFSDVTFLKVSPRMYLFDHRVKKKKNLKYYYDLK